MKQRFLNQKLGKRPSYRTRLLKAARPGADVRLGFAHRKGSVAATGKRAESR
jgi:hypothetical protein